MNVHIRPEAPADIAVIAAVTATAFRAAPPEYFMAVTLGGSVPQGVVAFHDAVAARDQTMTGSAQCWS